MAGGLVALLDDIAALAKLAAASVDDVGEFFKTYYAPINAVLSLTGDFNPDEAMRLIRKYFEAIPKQPDPPRVNLSEPAQTADRRETIADPLARLQHAFIVYKTVPGNTPDQYALEVLGSVLFGGDSSRLYQKLSKELELVAGIGGFVDERIGTGSLRISATVRPGRDVKDVEAAVYEELERIQREPIAAWELEKAKNATRVGYFSAIRGAQSRAMLLGSFTIKFKDPNLINTRMSKVEAVTAADVQRVARQYLQAKNRTVLITTPAAAAADK